MREDLALGKVVADSSYRSIKKRYQDRDITELEGAENSLFIREPTSTQVYLTGLLDTIEAADFV